MQFPFFCSFYYHIFGSLVKLNVLRSRSLCKRIITIIWHDAYSRPKSAWLLPPLISVIFLRLMVLISFECFEGLLVLKMKNTQSWGCDRNGAQLPRLGGLGVVCSREGESTSSLRAHVYDVKFVWFYLGFIKISANWAIFFPVSKPPATLVAPHGIEVVLRGQMVVMLWLLSLALKMSPQNNQIKFLKAVKWKRYRATPSAVIGKVHCWGLSHRGSMT